MSMARGMRDPAEVAARRKARHGDPADTPAGLGFVNVLDTADAVITHKLYAADIGGGCLVKSVSISNDSGSMSESMFFISGAKLRKVGHGYTVIVP